MVRKYQTYNFLEWEELIKIIVGELESHEQFFTWEINLSPVYQKLLEVDNEERTLAKIIDVIYSYYADQKAAGWSIWGDKTPLNTLRLSWLDKVFPNARYIHIIRDGRDVVSSYLKMGRYNKLKDAANRWQKSITLAKKFGRHKEKENYIEVRYENFVSHPQKIIQKACKFLNIDYEPQMTNHQQQVDNLGDVEKLSHHNNLQAPINTDSIGNWKKNLSKRQQEEVNQLLESKLKELNYK